MAGILNSLVQILNYNKLDKFFLIISKEFMFIDDCGKRDGMVMYGKREILNLTINRSIRFLMLKIVKDHSPQGNSL